MSPVPTMTFTDQQGFPRVSGDEPLVSGLTKGQGEFSPRERG